jgi:hypothetical protein
VLLFLPFLSKVKGIPFGQLPSYLKSGAGCFLNFGANPPGMVLLVILFCNFIRVLHLGFPMRASHQYAV